MANCVDIMAAEGPRSGKYSGKSKTELATLQNKIVSVVGDPVSCWFWFSFSFEFSVVSAFSLLFSSSSSSSSISSSSFYDHIGQSYIDSLTESPLFNSIVEGFLVTNAAKKSEKDKLLHEYNE